ncbi:MAG: prephenate dehydrogenase [Anaerolineaceae bacterium]|nr:prephenate dehydrogenase [Anaerolineaceae bacterium]
MTIKISIIGLRKIGASIGLALAQIKDQATRVGNDRDPGISKQAEKMGAVDKTTFNLPSAVRDADIVILAVPVNEIRETLEAIAPDLKPGSVVIDTSPLKDKVMQWAKEFLPGNDRYFVSVTFSTNPAYFNEIGDVTEKAHADLFQNSLMLISSLPGIDESALNLTTNLAQILGAQPLFSDAVEIDGLLASTHLLPKLISVALVNATVSQTGWREARKVAGQVYARVTEPALHPDEEKEMGKTALYNAENTLRVLDQFLAEIHGIRDAIANQEETELHNLLENALVEREQWWQQRLAANWDPKPTQNISLPTGGEIFGRLFGIRPKKDK